MMIDAKNILVSYTKNGKKDNTISIINSVDITIVPSKVTVIFGRSGSGKTTLISVLAGLLKPQEGSVLYDDIDLYQQNDDVISDFRSKNIGFIPQGQSLLSNLTIKENILLANNHGNDSDRADELIELLGLSEREEYLSSQLSGGELRRCAIARALINQPSVVFADEPTGDLDDDNTQIVFELLRQKAKDGAAVVIVTHDESAYNYADIVYRMDGGVLTLSDIQK
ncbi:MAG: ABC transporter ATP-binding protein [Lachnospiraceae bacterium]|nr:ABC transporter ATP-binding protein [Lachnospiraceae bacterium]